MRIDRALAAGILIVFALLFLWSIPRTGAIPGPPVNLFVVTTSDDHNDHVCDNDCTLREAIGAANTTAGNSVITFSIPTSDPGYSSGIWTITIAAALPDLHTSNGASNLSISGPGADTLIVQRDPSYAGPVSAPQLQFRIFNVTTSGTASISGMTITNGSVFSQTDYLGGGIQNYNAGTVSLTNCVLKKNEAGRWTDFSGHFGPYALGGGIANRAGGTINITTCTFEESYADYGGGIYNSGNGTVNVSNSTIGVATLDNNATYGGGIYNDGKTNLTDTALHENYADFGGGVYNDSGTVVITRCTLSNNSSVHSGGGVPNVGVGGGIYNVNAAVVKIINSTLFNNGNSQSNTNNGGGIYNAGTLYVTNSTLTHNYINGAGGGIFNDSAGTATIKSTIIAGNTFLTGSSGSVVGGPDVYGAFDSQGYNLVGTTDGSTGFNARSDLTGAGTFAVDPNFELANNVTVLKDNGGPTQTIALLCGSPAIDQGTSNGLTGALSTDQRGSGFPRTFDGSATTNADDGTDIGAFEVQQSCIGLTCDDVIFSENFDGVTAPALPAGWTTANPLNPDDPYQKWATSTTTPESAPNDAFVADPANKSDAQLTSPVIAIPTSFAKLIFRNNYNLYSAGGPGYASDGGVLEISINGGAFVDVIDAGGSFVSGGYNTTVESNPVACCNQSVWSGNSNGYINTIVNLPPSAGGQNIQLRWRLGSVANSPGAAGWRIDTIKIIGCTPPTVLANVSTRAFVQTGDNVLIGGFIVVGSGQKKVILRAIGPSLTQSGIANALADPVLELHDSTGALITSNDNWMDAFNHQAISDSGLAPKNNLESAILTSLDPGAYTAIVRGVSNGTGVALFEGYDLDRAASSELGNISARAFVQTGDNVMIGGFIVAGPDSETVVVRAIGPSLTQAGVANALADPKLELHDGNGTTIASNDNWKDTQQAQIQATGLQPSNDAESAILATLAPAAYTAIVFGKSQTTGVALVEVYTVN